MLATATLLRGKGCLLPTSLLFWAALAPAALAFPVSDSNPLYQFEGQVRVCHLYTADDQTHLFLEILEDGTVHGSSYQNLYSLMEIKAVKRGIVVIKAAKTLMFLCMRPTGQLHGSLTYSEEACNFRETIRHDGYNIYYSENYNIPISLSSTGSLAPGQPLPPFSEFLPLANKLPVDPETLDPDFNRWEPNVESADPFNMLGQNPNSGNPNYVSG